MTRKLSQSPDSRKASSVAAARPKFYCLRPDFTQIPRRLRRRKQWVVWRPEWNEQSRKYTKVPYSPAGYRASHSNPATWTTFELACVAYERGGWAGIGYVLTPDDRITGIDLDHCRDVKTGAIDPWALKIIKLLSSYSELSPSATGIRIFVVGHLRGRGRKKGGLGRHGQGAFEAYDARRYLTVTGHRLKASPTVLKQRQCVLDKIMCEQFSETVRPDTPATPTAFSIDDQTVINIACAASNGDKFTALYFDGDLRGYASQSEADLALMGKLSFYTGGNAEQMERLFTASALGQREKWSERDDYRQRTRDKVLANASVFYDPHFTFNSLMRAKVQMDRRGTKWKRMKW